jgi:hypothetical protein
MFNLVSNDHISNLLENYLYVAVILSNILFAIANILITLCHLDAISYCTILLLVA